MTLAGMDAGRGFQIAGLLAAALGAGATVIAPFCASSVWTGAGALGAGLDLASLRMRRRYPMLLFAMLKAVIVVAPILVLVMCAAVRLPPPPISPDIGPALILGSAIPSFVGALLWRPAR
jgi:hypothetical protein